MFINGSFPYRQQKRTMKRLLVLTTILGSACAFNFFESVDDLLNSIEHRVGEGSRSINCSCGWTNRNRVVGGRETRRNEFPLMGGVYTPDDNLVFCGAAIITPWHALSAAHCYVWYRDRLGLLVGAHDITRSAEEVNAHLIPISRVINHEKYDIDTLENDLSILLLAKRLQFNQVIGPACLPTMDRNLDNEFVKVLGWGLTSDGGKQSSTLQKANLRIVPMSTCAQLDPNVNTTTRTRICAWKRGRDSCEGDSGGPLLWHDPAANRFIVAGIVSYGGICASEIPGTYTNVAVYLPWIQRTIASTGMDVQTCA